MMLKLNLYVSTTLSRPQVNLPFSKICFIKEMTHVQIIYPYKKTKLTLFVSEYSVFLRALTPENLLFLICIFYYVCYGKIDTS